MNILMNKGLKNFIKDEEGSGTVEVILILVVLISLVIIFKGKMTSLVNDIFKTIENNAKSI
ncbi:MAG: hypothetical protein HUJ70_13585 [Pseudobutyrivibrio sp.]|nr:hypothetical protein [Pseudobutyrivibrio sp.]